MLELLCCSELWRRTRAFNLFASVVSTLQFFRWWLALFCTGFDCFQSQRRSGWKLRYVLELLKETRPFFYLILIFVSFWSFALWPFFTSVYVILIFCVSANYFQSSDGKISDAEAASLFGALERNSTLPSLHLSSECASNVAVSIRNLRILRCLDCRVQELFLIAFIVVLNDFVLWQSRVVVIVTVPPLTSFNHQTWI